MTTAQIIQICKDRNELEFLYKLTKTAAEMDSLGEGYSYCDEYTRQMFNNAEMHIETNEEHIARGYKDQYEEYLEFMGIPLYATYLEHINIL